MQQIPVPATNIGNDTLLRHSKRPQWGLGLCVDRADGRWTVQFEDGKARKLGSSYVHLLQVVALPHAQQYHLLGSLIAAAGVTRARDEALEEGRELITLDQQLRLFKHRHPDGFQCKLWSDHWRGKEGRRAKRHRDPAIAEAQDQLGVAVLSKLLADGYYCEIVERLQNVLAKTSLVTKKQLAPLQKLSSGAQRRLADALVEMMQDSVPFNQAHHRFIAALSEAGDCSWALATAPLALLLPDEYVCVSPTTFRKQAQWLSPDLRLTNKPDARSYQHLVYVAHTVRAKLAAAGLEPRDMFDVVDFMWSTLRPSAVSAIAELPEVVAPSTDAPRAISLIGYVQTAAHRATSATESSQMAEAA